MARKKIREYDSKRLLKEHLKRLANIDLQIRSAQVLIHFNHTPFDVFAQYHDSANRYFVLIGFSCIGFSLTCLDHIFEPFVKDLNNCFDSSFWLYWISARSMYLSSSGLFGLHIKITLLLNYDGKCLKIVAEYVLPT